MNLTVQPTAGHEGFVGWVLGLMERLSEVGVGLAIFIETFEPSIPSKAVLPVAGFLACEGRMSAAGAWSAAALGALLGALLWYAIGAALGRDRTRAIVGRIPLLDHSDFDHAKAVFARRGGMAVLVAGASPWFVRSFVRVHPGRHRTDEAVEVLALHAHRFRHFETAFGSGSATPSAQR